jgi:hypothetical protein
LEFFVCLSCFSWTRGRGGARGCHPARTLSLSFASTTKTIANPQWLDISQRHSAITPCSPRHRHGHRGHQTEAEHHHPPPEPSPRRQHRLDPPDQFPDPVLLKRDRAPPPTHANVTPSGLAARASHSSDTRPHLAPPFAPTCMAR